MKTRVTVPSDGQLNLRLQVDVPPGEYQVLLVFEETLNIKRPPLEFPVIEVGPWPENLSLRREDLYGDDGR